MVNYQLFFMLEDSCASKYFIQESCKTSVSHKQRLSTHVDKNKRNIIPLASQTVLPSKTHNLFRTVTLLLMAT